MSKLSVQVENQTSISNKVIASARTHARTAAAALAAHAAQIAPAEDKAEDSKAAKNKTSKNKTSKDKAAKKKGEDKEQQPQITAESCEAFLLLLAGSLE